MSGAHVGGGDEADGFDGGVLRADVAGHEAAHAVADEDEVGGVGRGAFWRWRGRADRRWRIGRLRWSG